MHLHRPALRHQRHLPSGAAQLRSFEAQRTRTAAPIAGQFPAGAPDAGASGAGAAGIGASNVGALGAGVAGVGAPNAVGSGAGAAGAGVPDAGVAGAGAAGAGAAGAGMSSGQSLSRGLSRSFQELSLKAVQISTVHVSSYMWQVVIYETMHLVR